MSRTGRFFDDLEKAFGKGSVTSGYRSQKEQDDLVAGGKTRARRSAHTYRDGYDFAPGTFRNADEVRTQLSRQGFAVDNVRYETGKGRNQGTGAHWHVEIRKADRVAQGGRKPEGNRVDYLSQVVKGLEPGENLGTPSEAPRIYSTDADLQARVDRKQGALDANDRFLQEFQQKIGETTEARREVVEERVEQVEAINQSNMAASQAMVDKLKPVFAVREQVANQLDKLTTMNPLERGVRAIFDLNYDKKHLTRQLDQFDRTIAMRTQDYSTITNLQTNMMKAVQLSAEGKEHLIGLDERDLEVKGQMLNMELAAADNQFKFVGEAISQESQVIQARNVLRQDTMAQIQAPEVLSLLGKAKANGGTVDYNGVPLTAAELQDVADRNEHQALQIEGARLARDSQKDQLAQQFATRLGRSLTESQVKSAIANGGMYQGVKIPQDLLTEMLGSHKQRNQIMASEVGMATDGKAVLQTGMAVYQQVRTAVTRTRSLFGVSPEMEASATAVAHRLRDLTEKLGAAARNGAPPEVLSAIQNEFVTASKGFDQQINRIAVAQAGGDKKSATYIASFMRGEPINSQAGVEAMIHFNMKGSLPNGMRSSPQARAAFAAVGNARNEAIAKLKKAGVMKPTGAQIQAAWNETAAAAVPKAYVGSMFNDVIDQIPAIAKAQGSPLGNISPDDWRRARLAGDAEGRQVLAARIGTDVPTLQRLIGNNTEGVSEDVIKKFQSMKKDLVAIQNSVFLRNIDQLPSAVRGQSNSSTLIQFARSPSFVSTMSTIERSNSGSSFGDFLAASGSQGFLTEKIGSWANAMAGQQAANDEGFRQQSHKLAKLYSNQPMRRAAAILGGMPGIDQHQEALLLSAIQKIPGAIGVSSGRDVVDVVSSEAAHVIGLESTSNVARRENDRIAQLIKGSRFKDPNLEAIRKVAAKHWDDYSAVTDGVLDRLSGYRGE